MFICTRVNNITHYLHDIIMRKSGIRSPRPKHIIVHKNNNTLDNRREIQLG